MKVEIKKLRETAIIPSRGSEYAAGYDLFANLDSPLVIPAQTTVKIGTGLSVAIPAGYFGGVFARSGLASKQGLRPSNCVGCVDSDYRGELIVALYNDSAENQTINPNDRIAQLVVIPFLTVEFEETEELGETVRGENGFGSTGI
ncbi:dUTP diphosphatase [Anoxybacterium hadale]|uniref:dUTP diphosphatase n=1 Tax=Anoxybacterium hadale TaxID=3408580 RepID=A0ACD1A8D9_9FIRM|nr:dUTP diphosphatase [Clostridiales bacterium]